jgi:hypothetical protein
MVFVEGRVAVPGIQRKNDGIAEVVNNFLEQGVLFFPTLLIEPLPRFFCQEFRFEGIAFGGQAGFFRIRDHDRSLFLFPNAPRSRKAHAGFDD